MKSFRDFCRNNIDCGSKVLDTCLESIDTCIHRLENNYESVSGVVSYLFVIIGDFCVWSDRAVMSRLYSKYNWRELERSFVLKHAKNIKEAFLAVKDNKGSNLELIDGASSFMYTDKYFLRVYADGKRKIVKKKVSQGRVWRYPIYKVAAEAIWDFLKEIPKK